jgi:hypothetical protein
MLCRKRIIFAFFCLIFPLFYVMGNASYDEARINIVTLAKQYQGVPYVYGGITPRGFDCSGFINYVYENAADMDLPRTTRDMWNSGTSISLSQALPGDIILFNTTGSGPSHAAILIDNNSMIHAVSDGPQTGVMISSLNDNYFAPRIIGVRSFFPTEENSIAYIPEKTVSEDESMSREELRSEPRTNAEPEKQPRPEPKPRPEANPKPGPERKPEPPAKPKPGPERKPEPPARPNPGQKPKPEPKPKTREELRDAGILIETAGFTITNQSVIYNDPIQADTGSGVHFAITNGTGKDGSFEILFYKMDRSFSNMKTLYQKRVQINAGQMLETDPIIFTEPGQYKLILKTGSNVKRVERVWLVER